MTTATTPDPEVDFILDTDLAKNQWPEKIDQRKRAGSASLMAQAMSREVFEGLKDHRTATAGWSIARAINTGVINPDSSVGCHAGDRESYFDFKELFHPVIEGYHKGYDLSTGQHATDLDPTHITQEVSDSTRAKVISTRIRVARNLEGFPLNTGGSKESRLEILNLIEQVVQGFEGDLKGTLLKHADMKPKQLQKLIDDRLLFKGRDRFQAASGHHRHWPAGRGVFLSENREFSMWVNEGDQLRIISMQEGGDIAGVFARLSRGIAAVETGIHALNGNSPVFLADKVLGIITVCPSNLGTAMRASVHMRIPKLTDKLGIEGIDQIARDLHCQARGGAGEHSAVTDRVDISNRRRLGFTECTLVDDMIRCANRLADMEDAL